MYGGELDTVRVESLIAVRIRGYALTCADI